MKVKGVVRLQTKEQIRKAMRVQRAAITGEARQAAAIAAMQLFVKSSLFSQNINIACYLANREEFDCTSIIEALWKHNKNCYLPVLSVEQNKHLEFALYQTDTKMRPNAYQILEPYNTPKISMTELDLIIMPLVAFDLEGNRLGMGGGYYDRTLSSLLEAKCSKPILMGLGYDVQRVKQLPNDSWDVPMIGILTERMLYIPSNHGGLRCKKRT